MYKLILFFVLNFSALGIGSLLIGNPGSNDWYQQLNKAPWTPPGWVFGFAWTSIMLCFSFYMYTMDQKLPDEKRLVFYSMFAIQWVLNVLWNPVFFSYHMVVSGLIVILLLTLLLLWFTWLGFKTSFPAGLLALPYAVWLFIATSLNAYIYLKN
jgi:translocator protein